MSGLWNAVVFVATLWMLYQVVGWWLGYGTPTMWFLYVMTTLQIINTMLSTIRSAIIGE